ncbi:hypothetical protein FHS18_004273 [Paenibacillus phyllosphaerae]|uniref:Uncharacterized protein n=1 Tax=Paenibacillus phyllosphaerae TaxID=274593 RepID=A0A7W5B0V5_9BACL|nr:hypothetical protein [Paenibacillus phyllosphaerae]MBB3112187.1 hypothetical protein [Paenibacillus phyllosphaerae]
MLKHLLKRFVHSLTGNKHYGHGGHYKRYSSSDYKHGYQRPPQYPPQQGHHYGHGHYKRKHSSFSS